MRALPVFSVIAAFWWATACGGATTALVDAAASDGAGTGAPSSGDGGCVVPTKGAACMLNQTACPEINACCLGFDWLCDGTSHTWQMDLVMRPPCDCFGCGGTLCPVSAYCTDQPRGVAPIEGGVSQDTHRCEAAPPSCLSSPTCACIEAALSNGDPCSTRTPGVICTDGDAGGVTIQCLAQ